MERKCKDCWVDLSDRKGSVFYCLQCRKAKDRKLAYAYKEKIKTSKDLKLKAKKW